MTRTPESSRSGRRSHDHEVDWRGEERLWERLDRCAQRGVSLYIKLLYRCPAILERTTLIDLPRPVALSWGGLERLSSGDKSKVPAVGATVERPLAGRSAPVAHP